MSASKAVADLLAWLQRNRHDVDCWDERWGDFVRLAGAALAAAPQLRSGEAAKVDIAAVMGIECPDPRRKPPPKPPWRAGGCYDCRNEGRDVDAAGERMLVAAGGHRLRFVPVCAVHGGE